MTPLMLVGMAAASGLATLGLSLLVPSVGLDAAISVGRAVIPMFIVAYVLRSFRRGEHVHRIWWAVLVAYASFSIFRFLIVEPLHSQVPSPIGFVLRVVTLAVGNIAWVRAATLIATMWRVAGLPTHEVRPSSRYAVAVVVATVVCGASLLLDIVNDRPFDEWLVLTVVSSIADVAVLVLMLPSLETAWRMRGGIAAIPVYFFAADSAVEVLVTDLFGLIVRVLGHDESRMWMVAQNSLSVAGNALVCAAAITQLLMAKRARDESVRYRAA